MKKNLSNLSIGRGEIIKDNSHEKINVILGSKEKAMYNVGLYNQQGKRKGKLIYLKTAKTYSTKYGALVIFSENLVDGMRDSEIKMDKEKNYIFLKISDFSKGFSKINLKEKRKPFGWLTAEQYLSKWSQVKQIDSAKIKQKSEEARNMIINGFMMKYHNMKKSIFGFQPSPQNVLTAIMKEEKHKIKENKKVIGKYGKHALYTRYFNINSTIPHIERKKKKYKEMSSQEQHDKLTDEIAKSVITQAILTHQAVSEKCDDVLIFNDKRSYKDMVKPEIKDSLVVDDIYSLNDSSEKEDIIIKNLTKTIEKLGQSILEKPGSGKDIESDLSELTRTMSQIKEDIIQHIQSSSSSIVKSFKNGKSVLEDLRINHLSDQSKHISEKSTKPLDKSSSSINTDRENIKSLIEETEGPLTESIKLSEKSKESLKSSVKLMSEIKSVLSKSLSEDSNEEILTKLESIIESVKSKNTSEDKSLITSLESIRENLERKIKDSQTMDTSSYKEQQKRSNISLETNSKESKSYVEEEIRSSVESLLLSLDKKIESIEKTIQSSSKSSTKKYELSDLSFSKHSQSKEKSRRDSEVESRSLLQESQIESSEESRLRFPDELQSSCPQHSQQENMEESISEFHHKIKSQSYKGILKTSSDMSELKSDQSGSHKSDPKSIKLDSLKDSELISDQIHSGSQNSEEKPIQSQSMEESELISDQMHSETQKSDPKSIQVESLKDSVMSNKIEFKESIKSSPSSLQKSDDPQEISKYEKIIIEELQKTSESSRSDKLQSINSLDTPKPKVEEIIEKDKIKQIRKTKPSSKNTEKVEVSKDKISKKQMNQSADNSVVKEGKTKLKKKVKDVEKQIEDKSSENGNKKKEGKFVKQKVEKQIKTEIAESIEDNLFSNEENKISKQLSDELELLEQEQIVISEKSSKEPSTVEKFVSEETKESTNIEFIRVESESDDDIGDRSTTYVQPQRNLFYREELKVNENSSQEYERKSINKEINFKKRELALKKKQEMSVAKQKERMDLLRKQQVEKEMEENLQSEFNERLKLQELEALKQKEEEERRSLVEENSKLLEEKNQRMQKERWEKERKAYILKMQQIKEKQDEDEQQRLKIEKMKKLEEERILENERQMIAKMKEEEYIKYIEEKKERERIQKINEEQKRLAMIEAEKLALIEQNKIIAEKKKQEGIILARTMFLRNLKEENICGKYSLEITRAFVYSYFELIQWVSDSDENKVEVNFMDNLN